MIGHAVDARRPEMALKGSHHFHGCAIVIARGRDAVAIAGQRCLQVADFVADVSEFEGFAANDRGRNGAR